MLTALARADRFGVIAIKSRSIPRHIRYLRQMGLMERLAGERPLEMSVAETASGEGTLARMITVGRELKELDGAGAIVMGCAGMARHRKPLEDALGIPVIDPTQARSPWPSARSRWGEPARARQHPLLTADSPHTSLPPC